MILSLQLSRARAAGKLTELLLSENPDAGLVLRVQLLDPAQLVALGCPSCKTLVADDEHGDAGIHFVDGCASEVLDERAGILSPEGRQLAGEDDQLASKRSGAPITHHVEHSSSVWHQSIAASVFQGPSWPAQGWSDAAPKMLENGDDVNIRGGQSNARLTVILAGDIGGTKTLLGVFDPTPARPRPLHVRAFPTPAFEGLVDIIREFAADPASGNMALSGACFGVAGPVLGTSARLTNVPFVIDTIDVSRTFAIPHVRLLNDLESMAYSVPVLDAAELHILQVGEPIRGGNLALIAAGTGLGEALIHNVGRRLIPSATEAGHSDWAARNERDIAVLRFLLASYGRAEVEHVISGLGLPNLHRALHRVPCAAGINPDDPDAPAALTSAALDRRCASCMEALEVFVEAYGAEAGNLALRSVATGGVYVGGGIAPKILPALTNGRFIRAFLDKGPMRALVERMPVKVILNAEAGLLGAAVAAAELGA
jgi:glucokinase